MLTEPDIDEMEIISDMLLVGLVVVAFVLVVLIF